eukprot:TRINITY_DN22352_c0_g1_i1.p1 TRINITY_DN22352_c0_g1~~TRINITY_DN22352_c0_g1_i1.p1  ORF type:complete len:232 (-),score=49.71 TRINITY_DN22352_c0_g1_i1:17-619(-)
MKRNDCIELRHATKRCYYLASDSRDDLMNWICFLTTCQLKHVDLALLKEYDYDTPRDINVANNEDSNQVSDESDDQDDVDGISDLLDLQLDDNLDFALDALGDGASDVVKKLHKPAKAQRANVMHLFGQPQLQAASGNVSPAADSDAPQSSKAFACELADLMIGTKSVASQLGVELQTNSSSQSIGKAAGKSVVSSFQQD